MDINPRERQGQAMAMWGAGIMIAPIIGPTIGGWLTENFNWRWVFYINVPVGALAFLGILAFMPDTVKRIRRFDFFGFAMLSLAVGSLQVMLDRGQQLDWFTSPRNPDRDRHRHLRRLGLRRPHRHRARTVPRTGPVPRSQLRRLARLHLRHRHHPARHHGAAAADAAEPVRLSGRHRRAGAGAARRRHDDLDARRRPPRPHRRSRGCWSSSA